LTGQLLLKYEAKNKVDSGEIDTRINRLADIMNKTLSNFRRPEFDDKRLQDLKAIVSQAARLGKSILMSPSRWEFNWRPSQRDLRGSDIRSEHNRQNNRYDIWDADGRSLVLVRFPTLIQRYTSDTSRHTRKALRCDCDNSSGVLDVLSELRGYSQRNIVDSGHGERVEHLKSEGHRSTPSLLVPEDHESVSREI